jgi:hypothetical protein
VAQEGVCRRGASVAARVLRPSGASPRPRDGVGREGLPLDPRRRVCHDEPHVRRRQLTAVEDPKGLALAVRQWPPAVAEGVLAANGAGPLSLPRDPVPRAAGEAGLRYLASNAPTLPDAKPKSAPITMDSTTTTSPFCRLALISLSLFSMPAVCRRKAKVAA